MAISKLSLFKRNDVWYIIYSDSGRMRWKSTGKKMKSDALTVLTKFKEYLTEKTTSILLSAFIEQFKTMQVHSLRPSTINRVYQPAFISFKTVCGDKLLNEYMLKDVETFKANRMATCRATTVNIEFRTLRAAFNLAVEWQLIKENPFLSSSTIKTAEQIPVYLSGEDFKKLLNKTTEQVLKDIFVFAVLTGMRVGEITNLKWQDVDLHRRQITVSNSKTFQTKSGKCRVIPIGEDVYRVLLRRSTVNDNSSFVFNKNSYQLLSNYVSKKFKAYCKIAGLNEAIHFHSLRHTYATWLVQSGVNIYQVQKLLGHSDTKTTQIYSHLAASELHSAVNKISIPVN
jgi:site-specific recombinase XerD